MNKIPLQLKDMKFNRVLKHTKKPFEAKWTEKPYTYEQISQFFPQENYGVMTGIDGLGVLDDDTEKKSLMQVFEGVFGETFRVRDHYYIKLKGWDGKKIIFHDEHGEHMGELQGLGQMVVGPGSTHPSGAEYDLRLNVPIKEIDYDDFIGIFNKYVKKLKVNTEQISRNEDYEGDDINSIQVSSVFSLAGLSNRGGGIYQGPHPVHGSDGGMNFTVNTLMNTWYCFRHQAGGGIWTAIAVNEGIIDCDRCQNYKLSESEQQKVLEIAAKKYGLKRPDKIQNTLNDSPKGWAKSVSIVKIAERHKFMNCHLCDRPLEFVDTHGVWRCPHCKISGNIYTFMDLIRQKEQQDAKTN